MLSVTNSSQSLEEMKQNKKYSKKEYLKCVPYYCILWYSINIC